MVNDKTAANLYLSAVENTVVVLPTKTKPKKFIFVGSDGKRYEFLAFGIKLKVTVELRADTRICSKEWKICTSTSASCRFCRFRTACFLNRSKNTAHVTTASSRSGRALASSSGLTALLHFSHYTNDGFKGKLLTWLRRKETEVSTYFSATNPLLDAYIIPDNQVAAVPRPSELFYNKLTPLLEAEGLSADPRQRNQWPLETLRKVLGELMDETPKDLVSRYSRPHLHTYLDLDLNFSVHRRELWLSSLNAEQWWSSTTLFGRSCAVMSVIGYIIGLGDRHLDNVLVDLRCGEVTFFDDS